MDREEIKLEATYWKEILTLLSEVSEEFGKINETLPTIFDDLANINKAQPHILAGLQKLDVVVELVKGRTKYLYAKSEEGDN